MNEWKSGNSSNWSAWKNAHTQRERERNSICNMGKVFIDLCRFAVHLRGRCALEHWARSQSKLTLNSTEWNAAGAASHLIAMSCVFWCVWCFNRLSCFIIPFIIGSIFISFIRFGRSSSSKWNHYHFCVNNDGADYVAVNNFCVLRLTQTCVSTSKQTKKIKSSIGILQKCD